MDTVPAGVPILESEGFLDVRPVFSPIAGICTYKARTGSDYFYLKVAGVSDESSVARLRTEWNTLMTFREDNNLGIFLPVSWSIHGDVTGMTFRCNGISTIKDIYSEPLISDGDWKLLLCRIRSVCVTLERSHALNIRHGGLRPEVIFINHEKAVDEPGATQIASWFMCSHTSIEKYLSSSENLGDSLYYVAPECTGRMNRGTDFRSDLYSLGVTLYQLVCKRVPFTG